MTAPNSHDKGEDIEKSKVDKDIKNNDYKSLILVGNPNVGKSVIFGLLTGEYVIVSNYPGTTVEIARSNVFIKGKKISIIDAPGVNNLLPMSADEIVTRDILLSEKDSFILQVADSKNINRTLLISLQLAEMGFPFILDLNMADEAIERRIYIDHKKLSDILQVEVVSTIAVSRTGIDKLKKSLGYPQYSNYKMKYDSFLEEAISNVIDYLPETLISKRSLALMVLAEDYTVYPLLEERLHRKSREEIEKIIRDLKRHYNEPVGFEINRQRLQEVQKIVEETVVVEDVPCTGKTYRIGKLCMHPLWGYPILLAVLVLMYYFVGKFAAGTVVDFLSDNVYNSLIMPWITFIVNKTIPFPFIKDALIGSYGIFSMGFMFALAIVLPIVASFFLFFGVLEDSGYLPRLAIIANRGFRSIGLNGKAILPLVLGLGCGTMATISSRILDSKKEHLMVIILLALGIPCSAQLGVIMGLISGLNFFAFFIWLFVVAGSLFLVGYVANKIIPGDSSDFILEVPPLRIPSMKNILIKTLARVEWYLKEAVPIFILATFCLFLMNKFYMVDFIRQALKPFVSGILGLPPQTSELFLVSFLRRDYGAAGFLKMASTGLLSNNQVLISVIVITLFLPCIAQFMVIIKERGLKIALGVLGFVFCYSLAAGGLVNLILNLFGVKL